jgi:hypothetical protein
MVPPVALPAHCEITGSMHEHRGADGQRYASRFHLRLPQRWNGRFFLRRRPLPRSQRRKTRRR